MLCMWSFCYCVVSVWCKINRHDIKVSHMPYGKHFSRRLNCDCVLDFRHLLLSFNFVLGIHLSIVFLLVSFAMYCIAASGVFRECIGGPVAQAGWIVPKGDGGLAP